MPISRSLRFLSVISLFILGSAQSFGQNTRLPYRPLRAEWNAALQRIVMVSSGPNQLHLFDPVARTTQSVALASPPVSLSISPNGLFAAVGHVGSASYVDLTARSVARTYTYPTQSPFPSSFPQGTEVVLASEWLYVLPAGSASGVISIRLSSGTSASLSLQSTTGGRLHPGGKEVYATSTGTLRAYLTSDIGLANPRDLSGQYCGGVWFSPDGTRIYTGCGTVARYSTDPLQDTRFLAKFAAELQSVSESVTGRIAAIPSQPSTSAGASSQPAATADNKILLIDNNGFQETGRLTIPEFNTATRKYLGQGRWAFFSNSGSALHVVYRAEAASGILDDFAVQTYELANPPACTASFANSTVSVGGEGSLRLIGVQAAADCVYSATSSADWVQIVSGGFGSGNGTMTLHIRSNPGAAARTGSVTIGSQTLQISQAGAPPTIPAQQIISYKVRDAEYSKALDRVVLVSAAPNELHLYDPVTRADQPVPLAYPALSVSVSPDGLKAAVGHNGFVSIVNLQTRAVEKVLANTIEASEVLLTGESWVYAFAEREALVIEIATGAIRQVSGTNSTPSIARLHASGNWAYLASSSSISGRLDVRNGGNTATSAFGNGFGTGLSNVSTCGNLWVSEDGRRFYTACGTVHRSSETTSEDGAPNGRLSGIGQAGWIAHSGARKQIAAVNGPTTFPAAPSDIQLYGDDELPLAGRVRLSDRTEGAIPLPVRGRWVFWNKASSRLFAITQIEVNQSSSQSTISVPLSDFALEVFSPETLAACSVTVTPLTLSLPGGGGSATVTVQTGPACVWSATVDSAFWLRASTSGSTSSFVGTGPGSVTVSADRNGDTAARSAFVTIGGVSVQVSQPLPNPLTVNPVVIPMPATGSTASVLVQAISAGLTWSAVSNADWLTVTNGPNFVGTMSVGVRALANTSTTPRSGTLTIAGETVRVDQSGAPLSGALRFVPVTPCRVADTRALTGETGAFGTPVMEGGSQRDFPIPQSRCTIPANATAYSLNVTVVPRGPLSFLTLWPAGQTRPLASTLNSFDGRIKANAAIVPAGANGAISAFVTDRTDVILDINGYFVPVAGNSSAFPFYSVSPCRVADTRTGSGNSGGTLSAGQPRNFVIAGACNGAVPTSAVAYSLNVTVIPRSGPLSYLTIWPAGTTRPIVSTLNAPTGTVVANAAIVPGGVGGAISVFATDAADVVIDINGYFGGSGVTPLSFFPVTPCRVSDTRTAVGDFGGPVMAAGAARAFTVPSSPCLVSAAARAYSLNATVVPAGPLSFLTIWPTGQTQPLVSTLNSFDGSVVANALLVPAGSNGAINAYVTDQTHLILDINGFFAQ